jgi:hypothetical protein
MTPKIATIESLKPQQATGDCARTSSTMKAHWEVSSGRQGTSEASTSPDSSPRTSLNQTKGMTALRRITAQPY